LYSEVKNYELNYDAYLDEEEIIEEIERLELILKYKESCDVEDEGIDILKKITQMAKSIGDWKKIIRNVKKSSSDLQNSVILKNLGIALIKTNSYGSEDYKQGIKYLERVIESEKTNADALSSLGGAYKGHDEKKAKKYYQLAFEREPYNPYFLGNYLIYELREKESTELLTLAKPLIRKAIGRSKKQILMNLNIPWAYFDLGLFNLFLGKLNRSVYNYILGIRYSTDNWMISTTYETLELLNNIENNLSGYKVVKKLMLLKLATNSRDKKYMKTLEEKYISDNVKISPPVLIIAGTTSPRNMKKLATYEQNLLEALEHYKGTVISGGSTSGISGITGKIQEKYPQDIETIGYIPESEKKGEILDNRYSKIQFTPYPEFSVREAIQYWLDIYANNIRPREVKLIGLGGGKISRLEYGIALILGGEIGIFKNSGGIADQFLNNEDSASFQEGRYNKFHILDNKVNQIQKFL
ncbi:MAG: tetratricopeptide repeat protein, partial [Promethearchaeia archaeon]